MDFGYTLMHRKVWKNHVLMEKGKRFSRLEAWLYIINVQARGVDDPDSGLKRGEFAASIRYLAEAWNWSRSAVHRFMADLIANEMIKKLGHLAGHNLGHSAEHFIVCNYEVYNPTRDTQRDTFWDTWRDKVNKDKKKEEKKEKEDSPSLGSSNPNPVILLEIYESENSRLPKVKARSQDRLAKCRSRINQAVKSGCLEQYLHDFLAAVKKAQNTPFLCGENARGWRADFDWFVANHTNAYRVLEGKYESGPTRIAEPAAKTKTPGQLAIEAAESELIREWKAQRTRDTVGEAMAPTGELSEEDRLRREIMREYHATGKHLTEEILNNEINQRMGDANRQANVQN
jgi:hypothetical protein